MAQLKDVLPEILKEYVDQNESNVIDEAINERLFSVKEEMDKHKENIIADIDIKFSKQKQSASLILLFVSIVFFAIGCSVFFYIQTDRIYFLEKQISNLTLQISPKIKDNNTKSSATESVLKVNFNDEIINYKIDLLTDQVSKLNNLYITFITGFTGFLMLILAWLFSSIQLKSVSTSG